MSGESEQDPGQQLAPEVKPEAPDPAAAPVRRELLPLPGLAVIALYMLVLSGVDILGVAGGYIRPIYLIFAAVFIAAGLGLLLLFRWAWTLTLAAVVLLFGLFLWRFSSRARSSIAGPGFAESRDLSLSHPARGAHPPALMRKSQNLHHPPSPQC